MENLVNELYSWNSSNKFLQKIKLFSVWRNLIKIIFGETMWDYSDYEFNIGKYISLEMATVWGISSLILIYLKEVTDKIVKKIPKFISWILIILFIIDLICTILFKT